MALLGGGAGAGALPRSPGLRKEVPSVVFRNKLGLDMYCLVNVCCFGEKKKFYTNDIIQYLAVSDGLVSLSSARSLIHPGQVTSPGLRFLIFKLVFFGL